MKLLIITPHYLKNFATGSTSIIRRLIPHFKKNNIDVKIIAPFPVDRGYEKFDEESVIYVSMKFSGHSGYGNPHFLFKFLSKVKKYIHDIDHDVAYIDTANPVIKELKTPYLVYFHGSAKRKFRDYLGRNIVRSLYGYIGSKIISDCERYALRHAYCLFNSENTKGWVLKDYETGDSRRFKVCYPSVDIDDAYTKDYGDETMEKLKMLGDKKILLNVGGFAHHKGQLEILEIIPHIVQAHKDVVFVFVGRDFGTKKVFIERAKKYHVDTSIMLLEILDNLSPLMAKSYLYVSAGDENFGIANVEAMARRAPIVGLNRGAVKEVVGEGGIIVDTLEELKKSCLVLLGDEGLRNALSQRAAERAKRFSPENSFLSVKETVDELCKNMGER